MDKQKSFRQKEFGSANPFNWSHDYLFQVLTIGSSRVVKSPVLESAFKMIDRADFVPREYLKYAYNDTEIPLGYNEYLDKPTVIAQMLQLLNLKVGGSYLDIGAGSGYVAALLGVVAGNSGKVFSLERKQFLADIARVNLGKYPFLKNVELIFADGKHGYDKAAPYDAIHVSAAYEKVPQEILLQVKIGGRIVAPTTDRNLHVYERVSQMEFKEAVHKAYFFDTIQTGIE